MAIGVIWFPPIDQQAYGAFRERVWQAGVDKGMQMHAAGELVFDVHFQGP